MWLMSIRITSELRVKARYSSISVRNLCRDETKRTSDHEDASSMRHLRMRARDADTIEVSSFFCPSFLL